ncbi:hypothetical protein ACQPZF_32175 [Actinosynnema sp. CS-041913]|uniref:hypothetical protein n=1 Tax=Actinosynnema sp. CS-041913 TaxID=3239917 RepID=UPI003D907E6C
MATNQDILYPGAIGKPLPLTGRLLQRYVDRLALAATSEPVVALALLDAFTLSKPMTDLARPGVVLAALRGPRRPAVAEPPLTTDELKRLS